MALAGGGSRRSKAARRVAEAKRIVARRGYFKVPPTAATAKIAAVRENLFAAKWHLDRKGRSKTGGYSFCRVAMDYLNEAEYHAATAPKGKRELLRLLRPTKARLKRVCTVKRGRML